MRYKAMISWSPGTIPLENVTKLLSAGALGIAPEVLRVVEQESPLKSRADIAQLLINVADAPSWEIRGQEGCVQIARIARWGMDLLIWTIDDHQLFEPVIDALSTFPGFNAAYVATADDVFWQSATSVNTYEAFDRPIPENLIYDEYGEPEIDVRNNPGRRIGLPGFWFCAAPSLWLGPAATMIFGLETLLAVEGARLLPGSSVVKIDLFDCESPPEWHRAEQRRFLEAIDVETIEAWAETAPVPSIGSTTRIEL